MKEIKLTDTDLHVALVDDEDYQIVRSFNWGYMETAHGNIYVRRTNRPNILLHRFLLDPATDVLIDHIDGDGFNNQRYNLRVATSSQNAMNRIVQRNNSSGMSGVTWYPWKGKWVARITKEGRSYCLGYFAKLVDAKNAREQAAIKMFGEFKLGGL